MTTDNLGGVWNYSISLMEAMAEYGITFHLATMGTALSDEQKFVLSRMDHVILHESNFKLEWMDKPWEDVEKALDWLIEIYIETRPDIIHFNNYGQVDFDWPCPVVTVFHSCVFSWWQAVKQENPPIDPWNIYFSMLKNALTRANLVIFPTESMMKGAKEIYGKEMKFHVIKHGLGEISPKQGPKDPVIFSMGRIWDESKNMQVLQKIAPAVDWPIYIAGEDLHPVSKHLTKLEHVHLLGKLSPMDVKKWLGLATIYIQPSLYEPFGLGVLEAAKSGCALVLNDINTFRELWGGAACFTDFLRPGDTIGKINGLIENKSERTAMIRESLNASESFSLSGMAKEYYKVYQELV